MKTKVVFLLCSGAALLMSFGCAKDNNSNSGGGGAVAVAPAPVVAGTSCAPAGYVYTPQGYMQQGSCPPGQGFNGQSCIAAAGDPCTFNVANQNGMYPNGAVPNGGYQNGAYPPGYCPNGICQNGFNNGGYNTNYFYYQNGGNGFPVSSGYNNGMPYNPFYTRPYYNYGYQNGVGAGAYIYYGVH